MTEDTGKLTRVYAQLEARDLDAVVAVDQANFLYTSGVLPPSRTGASMTVTPRTGPQAMIVSGFEESVARWATWIEDVRVYHNWIEVHDVRDLRAGTSQVLPKPVQFSKETIFKMLADVLRERGIDRGRIGIELGALSAQDADALRRILPGAQWIDSRPLMFQARAVKTPLEIRTLRVATEVAEVALGAFTAAPRGRTMQELRLAYHAAVLEAASERADAYGTLDVRAYISAGERVGPNLLTDPHRVRDGDILFIDCGCTVEGYASDIGRCYAIGAVDHLATTIHSALHEGYLAGLELLRPGVAMRDVFEAINRTVQRTLPTYTRGHFGHAPGIGFGEQPPFFAPSDDAVLEENMIVNIETPYYVKGLGGFQIEDMLLITSHGYESFNQSPREMLTI